MRSAVHGLTYLLRRRRLTDTRNWSREVPVGPPRPTVECWNEEGLERRADQYRTTGRAVELALE